MKAQHINKRLIFNDPIYGFISIKYQIIFNLIQHPYFQRLRRISQLGLSHLVYSGALHTRFHHAIGAMHLMDQAIEVIRSKGHSISEEDALGVSIAILLHDVGHGPFSHTLEHSIVEGVNHEVISSIFMDKLNQEFEGQLSPAIDIFKNRYPKKFLHQLVSSQLDMDRLDYLKRDSFFSGVSEGIVSSERIIKMLNVVDDQLAVEAKGIYSIEKFIIARRLMYWQVYLHKTVLAAEYLLTKILQRAKELAAKGETLFCTPALQMFLYNRFTVDDFRDDKVLKGFADLDDFDIMASIKAWCTHPDFVLSTLSGNLVNRSLYKIELQNSPFTKEKIEKIRRKVVKKLKISTEDSSYFVFTDKITNSAYSPKNDRINILYKDGKVMDVAQAADLLNISVLSKVVNKYFICYPKNL